MDNSAFLLAQAARFRRLAREIMDAKTEDVLLTLAAEYNSGQPPFQQTEPSPGTTPMPASRAGGDRAPSSRQQNGGARKPPRRRSHQSG